MADEAITRHPDNIAAKSPPAGEPPAARRGWWLP